VIDLGEQFLQGSFVRPGRPSPSLRRLPTALVRCDPQRDEDACGLLQMEFTVPPEILYSSYWYRSGTNATMREHLREIVAEAILLRGSEAPASVLDIGCNDGTLLELYPYDYQRFGIDPCDIAREIKAPIRVMKDFFPSRALEALLGGRRFDIITSIAMFYDLEDPLDFCRAAKSLLAPAGLWILEVAYMPAMLANTSYDTICHEHIEYYSLAVIEEILKRSGLKLALVSRNDTNGGSLRCAVVHGDNPTYDRPELQSSISALRRLEFDLELDTDRPYRAFQNRVEIHRQELKELLERLKAEGKSIHIYGASTKGNTILQWCGIDARLVDCAADRNPEKHGCSTLGTRIPIVSEEESRAAKPDYYLVLPWHFKREFLERERKMLESGVGLIFPLPRIEIVRKEV
jgi:SAM-dependent methyltransferase